MTFSIFDPIQFNLDIRLVKKTINCDSEKDRLTKLNYKKYYQIFLPSWCTIPLTISRWPMMFFKDAQAVLNYSKL
jgi:hypothetical protein